MDKCRICLGNKTNLRSILDYCRGVMCYADMIHAIAKVKIPKDTDSPSKLCRSCRRKLEDAYEFKLQIERADAAIHDNNMCKRLWFDDIKDIKIEIEVFDSKQSIKKIEDIKEKIYDGKEEFTYCSTLIKKVPKRTMDTIHTTYDTDIFLKPVPVLDFLRTIKDEDGDDIINDGIDNGDDFIRDDGDDYGNSDNNYSDDNEREDIEDGYYIPPATLLKLGKNKKKYKTREDIKDGDYIPPAILLKQGKNKNKYKTSKPDRGKENKRNICIKPINLKGFKLLMECKNRRKPEGPKRKYVKKFEMCPHCGIMTQFLDSHILKHIGQRSFKCDECGKGFYTENTLKGHKRRIHASTSRNFKCDQCVAAFREASALKNHQISHSTVKTYVCDTCSKAFKRKVALRRHVLGHSMVNKSINCDQCKMSFFTKYALKHHLRIHTLERPFCCQICSQPYSYKHDFNRHCLKKHGVFLKRRNVRIMNEEVLQREKQLIRDVFLRLNGVSKEDQEINPLEHEGPQWALAFQMLVKAIQNNIVPVDLQL